MMSGTQVPERSAPDLQRWVGNVGHEQMMLIWIVRMTSGTQVPEGRAPDLQRWVGKVGKGKMMWFWIGRSTSGFRTHAVSMQAMQHCGASKAPGVRIPDHKTILIGIGESTRES